eukprot:gene1050-1002_t
MSVFLKTSCTLLILGAAAHPEKHKNRDHTNGRPLLHTCTPSDPESFPVVYTAFYLWYGNPESDDKWMHWDHIILPHWDPKVDARYEKFNWRPPDEHHSPYRPKKGLYSSNDFGTLKEQFAEMKAAGVDVAVTSWWGQAGKKMKRDDNDSGSNTDLLIPMVLDAAELAGVAVAFHIEPYGDRNWDSVLSDIKYIHEKYAGHPAVYKRRRKDLSNFDVWNPKWIGEALPVLFLYDVSNQHAGDKRDFWRDMVAGIRGTEFDAYLVGLYIGSHGNSQADELFLEHVGFDAGYSYFASVGFTPATDYRNFNWDQIQLDMLQRSNQMDFIPSVGPGYNDTNVRPWNAQNTQDRGKAAEVYGSLFHHAKYMAHGLMVTSFNEWGEGTQIEPAVPYVSTRGLKYMDYSNNFDFDNADGCADCYLELTRGESDFYKKRFCEGATISARSEL